MNNFSSPCEESPDEAAVKVHVTPAVGASLLAKAVNDAACLMENRDALGAGEGNPTLKSLNAVFKPFGLQMGVVRLSRNF